MADAQSATNHLKLIMEKIIIGSAAQRLKGQEELMTAHQNLVLRTKRIEVKMKQLIKKAISMITIDGKEFSNSKDWPYLWKKSGK